MRRPLWAALTLFVFSYGYFLGARPVEALFSTPVDAIQVKLAPLNASLVLRQRLVNIRFDLLADGEKATVNLNLFDDVQVIAVRGRTDRTFTGGYAWYGRGEGGDQRHLLRRDHGHPYGHSRRGLAVQRLER